MTGTSPFVCSCGGHFPVYLGRVFGYAAVDLAIEVLDDLGAALIPPHFGRRDLFAVVEDEWIGEVGEGLALESS